MAGEQFSLCWDNFYKNMSSGMNSLLETEELVDVTLAVEGRYIKAHKMILSVCSPYFRELFQMNPCKHPIVFMKDVTYTEMNYLLTFMYKGEVQVNQDNLASFIKTAEALQIKGLTPNNSNDNQNSDVISFDDEDIAMNRVVTKKKPTKVKNLSGPSTKKARIEQSQTESLEDDSNIAFKVEPYENYEQSDVENVEEMPDMSLINNTKMHLLEVGEDQQAGTSQDFDEPRDPPIVNNNPKSVQRNLKGRRKEVIKAQELCNDEETDIIKKESNVDDNVDKIVKKQVDVAIKKDTDNNYNKKILVLQNKSLRDDVRESYKEDEQKFLDCLKKAVQNSNTPLLHVYKFNATLFPGVAKRQPYSTLVKAMKKWRFAALTNQK